LSVIFRYIKDYYQTVFHPLYFFLMCLLMGTLIYLNYWHGLELKYIRGGQNPGEQFLGYYLLYAIPFAIAFFIQRIFFTEHSYFKNYWFWIILFVAPAFFAFRVNFTVQEELFKQIWTGDTLRFWQHSLNWVVRVIVLMIPVYLLWWIKDRKHQPFYGTKKLDTLQPYLWMLIIMLPLIAIASTQTDFQALYPRAKFLTALQLPNKTLHYFIYELCYGFDFVSIEFFFRGFLILSLAKICGKHCILPVACFYCAIHFGKPMGEAISSFWGGLLLGIVSYHSRSIWGGLIVHLGIAWMMEVGGWMALFIKG